MFAFPKNGQGLDQKLKDESDCYGMAKQRTGIDPQNATFRQCGRYAQSHIKGGALPAVSLSGIVVQSSHAAIREGDSMRKHLVGSLILLLVVSCAPLRADNSQRDKAKKCNDMADQKQLAGEERKNFLSSCIKGDERTKPSEMSQKEKRKKCDEMADKKSLKGDDRKAFMATCLSTAAATRQ